MNEERAIVSEIAGTTRDSIEDEISIGGIGFRFIDTAGIRETEDIVEGIGIKKTFEKIEQAQVVVYLFDATQFQVSDSKFLVEIEKIKNKYPQKAFLVIANKIDRLDEKAKDGLDAALSEIEGLHAQLLSAKTKIGVADLKNKLLEFVNTGALKNSETIVTNTRHYDALLKALEEIQKVKTGMIAGLSSDLMAIDIREALHHLGEITGQVTNDELLGNIFSNFCIGK